METLKEEVWKTVITEYETVFNLTFGKAGGFVHFLGMMMESEGGAEE